MEITIENFQSKLGEIIDAIKNSNFIAIDTEFTGLLTDDRLKRSYFDSGSDIYIKERKNLKNVTICQIGLSAITASIDSNGYEAKTYNFYIMPKALLSVDPNITCQSSSVEFLNQAGFDFRKWLLKGIPCLKEEDEHTIRNEFLTMLSDDYNGFLPILVLDQLSIVEAWRQKAADGDGDSELSVFFRLPSFILHFMAAIYRRYNDITLSLHADEIKLCYDGHGIQKDSMLNVIKSSFEDIISENQGFVKVFNELKKDKIIILHNGMIDLTLMFKQFYRSLPENYSEFKSELHQIFPNIYDTKRIARMIAFKYKKHELNKNMGNLIANSSLEAIKMELNKCSQALHRPTIVHSNLTPKYNGTKCYFHEAGYDAFCTGFCFVNLAHVFKMLEDSSIDGLNSRPLSASEHVGAVKQWCNEIPLQNGGISYVVIGGENPPLNSKNWIVVQSHQLFSPLSTSQLNKLLAPFGRFEAHKMNNGVFLVASFRKNSIMEAFRCHELIHVAQYSPIKHSLRLRRMMWSAVFINSGLSICFMMHTFYLLK